MLVLERFEAQFGTAACHLFSAPGRTEIGGNHTDHNHGHVLAAAVDRDVLAAVCLRHDNRVVLSSDGFSLADVDLNDLVPHAEEFGMPQALIRGVAASLKEDGWNVGGFSAYVTSGIPVGSGLSSSAAFEMLLVAIWNDLYNAGAILPIVGARIGQRAENLFFGKPCGLMDQLSCMTGGVVAIDFEDTAAPEVQKIPFDFVSHGYRLLVVNTGGGHENMSDAYASLPEDMFAVARSFGQPYLRLVPERLFREQIATLRVSLGDRAVLRAMHFFEEDQRAKAQADAMKEKDIGRLLCLMRASGYSSALFLQNVFLPSSVRWQPLSLALAVCENVFGAEGVGRVHGGGFAGTIQAVVPLALEERFTAEMESVFGPGCCMRLSVRQLGAVKII